MAGSALDSQTPGFSTARVFRRAFGTFAAHPFAALGIVVLFGVLPGEALGYALGMVPLTVSSLYALALARTLVGWAFGAFCNTLIQGSFVGLTSAHDAGRRTSFLQRWGLACAPCSR